MRFAVHVRNALPIVRYDDGLDTVQSRPMAPQRSGKSGWIPDGIVSNTDMHVFANGQHSGAMAKLATPTIIDHRSVFNDPAHYIRPVDNSITKLGLTHRPGNGK